MLPDGDGDGDARLTTGVGWPDVAGGVDRDVADDGDVGGCSFGGVHAGVAGGSVVTQATCTAGEVTVPTSGGVESAGVTYVVVPAGAYDAGDGDPVTVTATWPMACSGGRWLPGTRSRPRRHVRRCVAWRVV